MISGFLLVYRNNMRGFFTGKIIRLCPLYYLTTILVYIIALLHPGLLRTTVANPIILIKSLLFIPCYVNTPTGIGVWPLYTIGWTLNIEIFVCIIYWLCFQLCVKSKKNNIWSGVISGIVLSVLAIIGFTGASNLFIDTYCQSYILWFAIGMFTACIKAALKYTGTTEIERKICCRWDLFSSWQQTLLLTTQIHSMPKFFKISGDISYSMYLTHYFVVCVFLRILYKNIVFSNPIFEIGKMLGCYFISWGIAYLSYRIIERKLTGFLKKIKVNKKENPTG